MTTTQMKGRALISREPMRGPCSTSSWFCSLHLSLVNRFRMERGADIRSLLLARCAIHLGSDRIGSQKKRKDFLSILFIYRLCALLRISRWRSINATTRRTTKLKKKSVGKSWRRRRIERVLWEHNPFDCNRNGWKMSCDVHIARAEYWSLTALLCHVLILFLFFFCSFSSRRVRFLFLSGCWWDTVYTHT